MVQTDQNSNKKTVRKTIPGLLLFLVQETLRQKKWVLLPLLVLLTVVALIILLSGGSFILPAIYIAGF